MLYTGLGLDNGFRWKAEPDKEPGWTKVSGWRHSHGKIERLTFALGPLAHADPAPIREQIQAHLEQYEKQKPPPDA